MSAATWTHIKAVMSPRYERARWRLATALDRLPQTCWAHLVSWQMRSMPLRNVFTGRECQSDSRVHRDRNCYCNQWQNGCRPKRVAS